MKKNIFLTLLFVVKFTINISAQTGPPCNCTSCYMSIDSVVNNPVSIPDNLTLCVGTQGVLNGILNMGLKSKLCNNGTIKGNIYMKRYAKICNAGIIDIDSMQQDWYCGITNYGNIRVVKDINPLKTEYIVNHGCMTYLGNVQSEGTDPVLWGGKVFIGGDWHLLGNVTRELVIIDGYIEVKGTVIVDGDSKLAINPGRCLKAGSINLKAGYIDGIGPGYSRIEILNGSGPATGGMYTGMLDICMTASPGSKPVAKSIDPTVTFCAHPEIACTFSRCDTVKSTCAVTASVITTHPYCNPKPANPYGSVTLTPAGGTSPYTFSWSSGQTTATVTNLKSGTYTITFTDASGCSNNKIVSINPAAISPLLVQSNDTLYAYPKQSGNLNLYRWFLNGALIAGYGLDYYVVTQPGAYSVNVATDLTSENACTGVSNVINVYTTGLMNRTENDFLIRVIPNPFYDVFSIYFDLEKEDVMSIEIMDIMGKQIYKTQKKLSMHDKIDVDISGYAKGLYFLNVKNKQGVGTVLKIVNK